MKPKNLVFVVPIIIIVVFALLVVISGCKQNNTGNNDVNNTNFFKCVYDSDCVKVQLTCCPCNMGGKETCVHTILKDIYKKDCGEEMACIAIYACSIDRCACINGSCTVVLINGSEIK